MSSFYIRKSGLCYFRFDCKCYFKSLTAKPESLKQLVSYRKEQDNFYYNNLYTFHGKGAITLCISSISKACATALLLRLALKNSSSIRRPSCCCKISTIILSSGLNSINSSRCYLCFLGAVFQFLIFSRSLVLVISQALLFFIRVISAFTFYINVAARYGKYFFIIAIG